jgi:O-antigen ligase
LITVPTVGPKAQKELDQTGAYDSSVVRTYSFSNAVRKIKARPVLGTGGGTYTDYIPQLKIGLGDPNNMFLLTWAELGIAGIAAIIFLLYRFGELFLRVARLPLEARIPGVAAGGVAISLIVHFQVDVTWSRGTTSLAFAMMGVMLAAQRLAPTAEQDAAATELASVDEPRRLAPVV